MKFLILFFCCAAQILNITCRLLPDRLPQPCSKSVPDFSECMGQFLSKMGPHLLKGIRELNFPGLDPLDVPQFAVNRTLGKLVSITANMKNLQFAGYDTARMENFKFDPQNMNGELHITLPRFRASFEYEVSGKFLGIHLNHAGFFKGNFTNLGLSFKFNLKQTERLGVQYYAFDGFKATGTIGDGRFKLAARNSEDQAVADEIVNFYNEYPKLSMDAIQPIYDESLEVFYKFLAEQLLNAVPAKELILE